MGLQQQHAIMYCTTDVVMKQQLKISQANSQATLITTAYTTGSAQPQYLLIGLPHGLAYSLYDMHCTHKLQA
jgi:hypothetical protein